MTVAQLRERELILARAKRHGILIPRIAWTAAKQEGLAYEVACAILMHETSGGANIFGHDPTIYAGAGAVTYTKYHAYLAERKRTGECQGVGPCQLTSAGLQDEADQLGGCWVPLHNCQVGFHFFHDLMGSYGGIYNAAYHYNGSGPAAAAYANSFINVVSTWRSYLYITG